MRAKNITRLVVRPHLCLLACMQAVHAYLLYATERSIQITSLGKTCERANRVDGVDVARREHEGGRINDTLCSSGFKLKREGKCDDGGGDSLAMRGKEREKEEKRGEGKKNSSASPKRLSQTPGSGSGMGISDLGPP
ncbi:hypothetical protein F5Y09DRAFT_316214, partial [Xylaria sp. FL1042]